MSRGGRSPANSQEGLKKRLDALLKLPEHQVCADCPERGPRWASANLGVFICINCSGIHRNLGVHISFVRSVNLDDWKEQHVENMEKWGNSRAKLYYEADIPSTYQRPRDSTNSRALTTWIRDKYEFKRFVPRDGSIPDKPEKISRRGSGTKNSEYENKNTSRERKPRNRNTPTSDNSISPTAGSTSTTTSRTPSSNSTDNQRRRSTPKEKESVKISQTKKESSPPPEPVKDLLDFDDTDFAPASIATTTPSTVILQQPQQQQQQQHHPQQQSLQPQASSTTAFSVDNTFGQIAPLSSSTPNSSNSTAHASFSTSFPFPVDPFSAQQQQEQQQHQPNQELTSDGRPKLSADDLMKMFSNMTTSSSPVPGAMNSLNSINPMGQAMMPGFGTQMPQPPMNNNTSSNNSNSMRMNMGNMGMGMPPVQGASQGQSQGQQSQGQAFGMMGTNTMMNMNSIMANNNVMTANTYGVPSQSTPSQFSQQLQQQQQQQQQQSQMNNSMQVANQYGSSFGMNSTANQIPMGRQQQMPMQQQQQLLQYQQNMMMQNGTPMNGGMQPNQQQQLQYQQNIIMQNQMSKQQTTSGFPF